MALKGNVNIQRRKNKSDRSWTYYLVWRTETGRGCLRLGRTGPRPGARERYRAMSYARDEALLKQRELTGDADGRPAKRLTQITIRDAIDKYLLWLEGDAQHARQRSFSTIFRQARSLRQFRGHCEIHFPHTETVNQLTSGHINGSGQNADLGWRYAREAQDVKPATVRVDLADIGAWLKW